MRILLLLSLAICTSSLSATETLNQKWHLTRGTWTESDSADGSTAVTASGNLDNRLVISKPAPASFRWNVDINLTRGWSAGLLLYAAADAQHAYAVRLDNRLNEIILERIGPWPEAEKLDSFPWRATDGPRISLTVEGRDGKNINVYRDDLTSYPILQALNCRPSGNNIGLQLLDAEATFKFSQVSATSGTTQPVIAHVPKVGKFTHVYDPQLGNAEEPWYINDHCFIRHTDGNWHLFGITHAHPGAPLDELHFAHAISPALPGDLQSWKKQPFALSTDPAAGERHLWAPHVIKRDDTYYMFYCAGSEHGGSQYRLHLATSPDLKSWTRHPDNPIFQDTFDARDPMILEDGGLYYLYYTANSDRNESHHVVHLRTSTDLLNWSPASIALKHPARGTGAGPTESPTVVKHGGHFYMFIGPAGEYHRTTVYRSPNPLHWNHTSEIYAFPSHAAEVIQDEKGNYYASDSGWDLRGVYLAPLTWEPQ